MKIGPADRMVERESGIWGGRVLAAVLLPALALFCVGALTDVRFPGVYMDAVTPDYLVVRILHLGHPLPEVWSLPGQLLLGRFPLLFQLYHGALPVYLGLPVYALLGTGLFGIRVANALFGCLVLASVGLTMIAFRVRPALASVCLGLLALDPGFLFSFRTQLYITMLAAAPLFASVALAQASPEPTPRTARWAGLLTGLACYGYFIYGFLAPTAALHAWARWRGFSGLRRRLTGWIAGCALGVAAYPLGILLLATTLGSRRTEFLHAYFGTLQVAHSSLPLGARLGYFWELTRGTLLDLGPSTMMLGGALPIALPALKLVLLLGVPLLALALGAALARAEPPIAGLAVMVGFAAGLLALVLLFGDRLWMHHAVVLLPGAYAALAFSLELAARSLARPVVAAIVCVALAPLLATNVVDRLAVFRRLEATAGVGLYSDALTRFAEDSTRVDRPTHVFFPDWGLAASFAMLTGGDIPYTMAFTPELARSALCAGTDAVVATVASQPAGRIDGWTAAIGWSAPERALYRERQGAPVLIASRWRAADRPAGACP